MIAVETASRLTINSWTPFAVSSLGFVLIVIFCKCNSMEQQTSGTTPAPTSSEERVDEQQMCQWILDIRDPAKRETALLELSKKRETIPDLPVWIWQSYGTMTCLLQEVIGVYTAIMPPTLTATQSNRVCNALALMQCVAAHKDTRRLFLEAKIPLFLYPFLHTTKTTRPFEYLRLTSLGVIGAMVKTDEKDVIRFLLSTEIIPLCLRIMEQGTELSRTVSTFILQKILLDDLGLDYVCQTYERFSHVAIVLGKVVQHLTVEKSARLFKHVVRCYARLSDNNRAVQALAQCLPEQLRDQTFKDFLEQDRSTEHFCKVLLMNIAQGASTRRQGT
ncbi:CCR4-NOT transcription complex subunit 9 [Aphelenchoides besseyi]|nr:CCR4-NOT transcription complex subunit 9 [Aphelenchoides besseyi]